MQQKLILYALLLAGLFLAAPCLAQEEVSSGSYRYKDREASTGYYEEYEVRPGRASPFLQWNKVPQDVVGYAEVDSDEYRPGNRSFKADSHAGLNNYRYKRCADCHKAQAMNNRHVTRANISCRQCHGGEPISGVEFYHSPLNPIRRHAYVCSKCHQGASGSFAMYVVHEPSPLLAGTANSFPVLYWAAWIMVLIAVSTFALFLPHTGLWMLRELFTRRRKGGDS